MDIIKASIMTKKKDKYNVILAFYIDVDDKIELEAKQNDITIIKDNVIYTLIKKVNEHFDNKLEEIH